MNKIDTFLQTNLNNYVDETAELCAQPSVSARSEGVTECATLVAKILIRHGFEVQTFQTPGHPIVVGHMKGQSTAKTTAARTLLLYNHYDVQPPEPLELWDSPPFEPMVRDDAIYARGASDDKGQFITRLAAVDAVRAAHDGTLPCNITFVVEGEEEIGSPHIASFVQAHTDLLKCQGSIWEGGGIDPDGHPINLLGARGILGIELHITTMTRDAHSGNAHILPNAAWRLVRVLDTLKDPNTERVRIPGFYDQAKPPSETDLELLKALPAHEALRKEVYGVETFLLGRTGEALKRAVFEPTCNIQGITTGYQGDGLKTVIPAEAIAKLDFRLVPDQDPEDILAKLRDYLVDQGFYDVQIRRLGAMWPFKMDADDPLVQLTAQSGAEVYKKPALISPLIGGSSPMYAFSHPLGDIPVVWAGSGYWDNRAHAPNEHMRLMDLLNGARHIARIIEGFDKL